MTARGQARTGVRRKGDPPRRSGEGRPLRAFGPGRRVCAADGVEFCGRACARWARPDLAHAGQDAGAVAMAMAGIAADVVEGAGICCRCGSICRGSIRHICVLNVSGDLRRPDPFLVCAIRLHRSPAELEWQEHEQHEGEEATHGPDANSGARPLNHTGPAPVRPDAELARKQQVSTVRQPGKAMSANTLCIGPTLGGWRSAHSRQVLNPAGTSLRCGRKKLR